MKRICIYISYLVFLCLNRILVVKDFKENYTTDVILMVIVVQDVIVVHLVFVIIEIEHNHFRNLDLV